MATEIDRLFSAIKEGDVRLAHTLLEQQSFDVNTKDKIGWSPIHWAARKGSVEIIQALIQAKANLELKSSDNFAAGPLHLAAKNGHFQVVSELLRSSRVNPDSLTNKGWSALHFAAFFGQLEVVQILIQGGANLEAQTKDKDGNTALHLASENNFWEIVQELIYSGADPNLKNLSGKTPMDIVKGKEGAPKKPNQTDDEYEMLNDEVQAVLAMFREAQANKETIGEWLRRLFKDFVVPFSSIDVQGWRHILGKGSFGEVYKGRWDHKPVAIKKIPKQSFYSMKKYLKREIEVLSNPHLNHSRLVRCLGVSYDPKSKDILLIMQLIEGGSLAQRLFVDGAAKKWNDTTKIRILHQIAEGVCHLHKTAKMIHRDLKPENILLDDSLNVYISDFGGLKSIAEEMKVMTLPSGETEHDFQLSRVGTFHRIGTLLYLAPEIIADDVPATSSSNYSSDVSSISKANMSSIISFEMKEKKYSTATDVYSFGLIAYELFTGRRAFPSQWNVNEGKMSENVVAKKYRPSFPSSVPFLLVSLISSCWNDDPLQRPTMEHVMSMLASKIPTKPHRLSVSLPESAITSAHQ